MYSMIKTEIRSLIEVIKGFRTIKQDWKNKTPLQKWYYMRNLRKIGFGLAGIPLYHDDQRLHLYSYFLCFYSGLYTVLMIYTAWFYISHGEFMKCLPSTCLLIGPILAYIPLITRLLSKERFNLHNLVEFSCRHIYRDDHGNDAYNRICSEQMDESMEKVLNQITIMCFGGLGALLTPLYSSFVLDIKTTTIEVKYPFIAEKSSTEFYMNFTLQCIVYWHGCFAYFGIEIMMEIFQNFTEISSKLIRNELIEMNDIINRKKLSELQQRSAFKNILLQLHDCDSYLMSVRDYLYWKTFLTPFLYTYSIGMSIFCQFTMKFVAGYGMAWMSYSQLFYICETGEAIESNDFDDILYEVDWYNLPTDVQKDVMHLINRMQNGVKLTVGPWGSVNRELFKITTNKIYSFIMFLLNFGS